MSKVETQDAERLQPAEAFSVLANDTRLTILEALWRAPERPVSFSDLRRQVGMADSAQFNYHLRQLTDHFIRKVEEGERSSSDLRSDGGYDFRHAGKKVVRAIFAGSFNEHPRIEPFEIDGTCAACGATLQACYDEEQIEIDCAECGSLHGRYPFPPGGLKNRDREEVVDAFDQRVRHLHCLAADGVCPECNGRMDTTITPDTEGVLGLDVRVDHVCEQCHHRMHSAVGLSLLDQSDVVSFYRDHGIDLCSEPYWKLTWCVSDQHTSILASDPWRLRVDIPLDDETLSVTLDDDLTVVDVETSRERSAPETESAV